MPREQPERSLVRAAISRALAGAAGACLLLATPPALAQDLELRGQLSHSAIDDSLLGSQSAISRSILDSPGLAEDLRTDSAVPIPRPTSAVRRSTPEGTAQKAGDAAPRLAGEGVQTTGTVRAQSADALDAERNLAAEPENQRALPIEGLYRQREDDPYAPLGLRLGTFVVTSELEQGLGWTSNADSSPSGESALFSETTLRLSAVSNWSRHSAALSAFGTFRKSVSGAEISEPEGGLDGRVVFDLGSEYRATAALRYDLRPESATSPVDLPPTVSRPLRHTLDGSLGLEKDVGKFRFGIRGEAEREMFEDADLEGGGVLSQRERNSTLTTLVLRGGYEISPAVTPFVEGEIGRRVYDLTLDDNGFARSADRLGARAGLALDFSEKLGGEIAVGWLRENPDDARLEAVSGATVNADLFWSPIRGTLVGLRAATSVEGTTTPGESGSILHSGTLSVERKLRANLTGNAALEAEWRDYAGSDAYDLTLGAEVGLTWWLNRYAGLTGRARHETVRSNLPGRDSETTSVFLGVKLQR